MMLKKDAIDYIKCVYYIDQDFNCLDTVFPQNLIDFSMPVFGVLF